MASQSLGAQRGSSFWEVLEPVHKAASARRENSRLSSRDFVALEDGFKSSKVRTTQQRRRQFTHGASSEAADRL
jgi:hypothetical protein